MSRLYDEDIDIDIEIFFCHKFETFLLNLIYLFLFTHHILKLSHCDSLVTALQTYVYLYNLWF